MKKKYTDGMGRAANRENLYNQCTWCFLVRIKCMSLEMGEEKRRETNVVHAIQNV